MYSGDEPIFCAPAKRHCRRKGINKIDFILMQFYFFESITFYGINCTSYQLPIPCILSAPSITQFTSHYLTHKP